MVFLHIFLTIFNRTEKLDMMKSVSRHVAAHRAQRNHFLNNLESMIKQRKFEASPQPNADSRAIQIVCISDDDNEAKEN